MLPYTEPRVEETLDRRPGGTIDPQSEPLSRTEISTRINGIIADAFSVGCCEVRGPMILRFVGIKIGERPRSTTHVAIIVNNIEKAFAVRLDDAHERFAEFALSVTVADLGALVEGALSAARGIA